MGYYISKTIQTTFEDALLRIKQELEKEGFGILTEIDVAGTIQKKLHADFRQYHILGACNPALAYEALQTEDKIGVLLPCNVIVQEVPEVGAEIAAVDPAATIQAVGDGKLTSLAGRVRDKLKAAINRLA